MSAWVCRAGGDVFLILVAKNVKIEFSGWELSVKITLAGGAQAEELAVEVGGVHHVVIHHPQVSHTGPGQGLHKRRIP